MIVQMRCSERFQFTHPRRGATVLIMDDIYKDAVSIHAPQEGCDCKATQDERTSERFQFTHPRRGATSFCWRM